MCLLLEAWGRSLARLKPSSSLEQNCSDTSRPRWATRTASASAEIPRLLLLSHHHRPLFLHLHLAPAGLAVLAGGLLQRGGMPFGFLPLGNFTPPLLGIFWLPPPTAACSARPAGVALSISHLYPPAPKHKWRHGDAGRESFTRTYGLDEKHQVIWNDKPCTSVKSRTSPYGNDIALTLAFLRSICDAGT